MNDSFLVFGVELEFLLRRETGSEHVPWGTVPTIIEQCLSEVESRGLSEVGICTLLFLSSILKPKPNFFFKKKKKKIGLRGLQLKLTTSRTPITEANILSENRLIFMLFVIW